MFSPFEWNVFCYSSENMYTIAALLWKSSQYSVLSQRFKMSIIFLSYRLLDIVLQRYGGVIRLCSFLVKLGFVRNFETVWLNNFKIFKGIKIKKENLSSNENYFFWFVSLIYHYNYFKHAISQNIKKIFQSIFYIYLTLTYAFSCAFFLVITITAHKSIFATKSGMLVLKQHQIAWYNGLLFIAFFMCKTISLTNFTCQNQLILFYTIC